MEDVDHAALGVSSGPCGAAALAGVRAALTDPTRRGALQLGPDAVLVLLSTEAHDGDAAVVTAAGGAGPGTGTLPLRW